MTSTPRHREITSGPLTQQYNWRTWSPPSGPWIDHYYNSLSQSYSNTMDDFVTDDFFRRIGQGEIINNSCSRVDSLAYYNTGTTQYHSISTGTLYEVIGNGSYISGNESLWPKNIDQNLDISSFSARAKLHALAKMDTTPYSFAEDLGEVRETIQFLKSPLKSLLDLSKAYRSRRKAGLKAGLYGFDKYGAKEVKGLTDAYLTFRFAASPLVRSSMSLVEALQSRTFVSPRRSSHHTIEDKEVLSQVSDPGGPYFTYDWDHTETASVKANILYEVTNPLSSIGFKYGLRLKDIPRTAWDLVPLSFMVDRIVNIGQNISALTNFLDPSVKILAASVTIKRESHFNIELVGFSDPDYVMDVSSNNTAYKHNFTYNRVVWTPTAADIAPIIDTGPLLRDIQNTADLVSLIVSNLVN